ncbi:unnamed protein product [[Candida] boidinii]|uniref:Unnamed protein product n=1 Tax=Candida boidinii TaxID=5477 RepID=A0A9W6WHY2_CANBO|nr:hypothetical protein B5S30_g1728 [[Candida] boidinii]GME74098.1 unnamed protein product [[Candida] boidinii]GMG14325.1 unnamed protein product [[Candida] boidinii]
MYDMLISSSRKKIIHLQRLAITHKNFHLIVENQLNIGSPKEQKRSITFSSISQKRLSTLNEGMCMILNRSDLRNNYDLNVMPYFSYRKFIRHKSSVAISHLDSSKSDEFFDFSNLLNDDTAFETPEHDELFFDLENEIDLLIQHQNSKGEDLIQNLISSSIKQPTLLKPKTLSYVQTKPSNVLKDYDERILTLSLKILKQKSRISKDRRGFLWPIGFRKKEYRVPQIPALDKKDSIEHNKKVYDSYIHELVTKDYGIHSELNQAVSKILLYLCDVKTFGQLIDANSITLCIGFFTRLQDEKKIKFLLEVILIDRLKLKPNAEIYNLLLWFVIANNKRRSTLSLLKMMYLTRVTTSLETWLTVYKSLSTVKTRLRMLQIMFHYGMDLQQVKYDLAKDIFKAKTFGLDFESNLENLNLIEPLSLFPNSENQLKQLKTYLDSLDCLHYFSKNDESLTDTLLMNTIIEVFLDYNMPEGALGFYREQVEKYNTPVNIKTCSIFIDYFLKSQNIPNAVALINTFMYQHKQNGKGLAFVSLIWRQLLLSCQHSKYHENWPTMMRIIYHRTFVVKDNRKLCFTKTRNKKSIEYKTMKKKYHLSNFKLDPPLTEQEKMYEKLVFDKVMYDFNKNSLLNGQENNEKLSSHFNESGHLCN